MQRHEDVQCIINIAGASCQNQTQTKQAQNSTSKRRHSQSPEIAVAGLEAPTLLLGRQYGDKFLVLRSSHFMAFGSRF